MIIYKITNKNNGKCYIGQTKKSLELRIKEHKKSIKSGSQTYFHNAIRKYGWLDFTVNIICSCSTKSELNEKEIYNIKKFNSFGKNGYNLSFGGESNSGWKPSKETIQNFKKAAKKRWNKENREKASIKQKQVMSNIEYKTIISKKIKKTCNLPEFKKQQSIRQEKLWNNPEYRQRQEKLRNQPNYKQKLSKSIKKSWNGNLNRKHEMSMQIKEMRIKRKHEFRMFNAKKWEINGKIINDLVLWCNEHNINYNTFYYYKNKDKCYNGYYLKERK